jgi:hypothetical protein
VGYFWLAAPEQNRPRTGSGPGHHFLHDLSDGRQQRQAPLQGALQQESGDDETVDLVGAFEDAIDAGVAPGALRGVFLDIAVAAVDLQIRIHRAVQHLRAPDFYDGALDGIFFDALLDFARGCVGAERGQRGVDGANHTVNEGFAGEDAGGHVSDLFLHQAERRNGFAEGHPLLAIANRIAQRVACAAERRGA